MDLSYKVGLIESMAGVFAKWIKVRVRWLGAVLRYSGKLVVCFMSLNILMIIIHH